MPTNIWELIKGLYIEIYEPFTKGNKELKERSGVCDVNNLTKIQYFISVT